MLQWSDALSVGVRELDDQHCVFVGLVNALSALSRCRADSRDLRELFADVVSYAEVHFVEEEALMERAGYPLLAEHKDKHAAAAVRIHDLLARDADEVELYRFLSTFLRRWLEHHIMVEDMAFGRWLAANRPEGQRASADPSG